MAEAMLICNTAYCIIGVCDIVINMLKTNSENIFHERHAHIFSEKPRKIFPVKGNGLGCILQRYVFGIMLTGHIEEQPPVFEYSCQFSFSAQDLRST